MAKQTRTVTKSDIVTSPPDESSDEWAAVWGSKTFGRLGLVRPVVGISNQNEEGAIDNLIEKSLSKDLVIVHESMG